MSHLTFRETVLQNERSKAAEERLQRQKGLAQRRKEVIQKKAYEARAAKGIDPKFVFNESEVNDLYDFLKLMSERYFAHSVLITRDVENTVPLTLAYPIGVLATKKQLSQKDQDWSAVVSICKDGMLRTHSAGSTYSQHPMMLGIRNLLAGNGRGKAEKCPLAAVEIDWPNVENGVHVGYIESESYFDNIDARSPLYKHHFRATSLRTILMRNVDGLSGREDGKDTYRS